jgi:hypothetical protein
MVAASVCAGAALAQQQQQRTYIGGNLVWADYSASGSASASPTALAGRLGREFSRHLAVEGRVGLGIDDDAGVDLDYFFGVYGRGILPLADIFSIYGLLGFTAGKVSAPGRGSDSDTDISYGFGADLAIGRNLAVNFEWAKLFEGSGYEVEATSLGLVYRY